MSEPSITDWITALVALIGVPAALIQYSVAQRWKRAEWVAEEMRRFLEDPYVHNALYMLDWKSRKLPLLLPGAQVPQAFNYTDDLLDHGLTADRYPKVRSPYSDQEVCIRDSFDRLLGAFDRFDAFIEGGLVRYADLKPYLQYWLEIIGDPSNPQKSQPLRQRLWGFIRDYEYSGAQRLLVRAGCPIPEQW